MEIVYNKAFWVYSGQFLYILILFFVCVRILIDTRSVSKTLAWLLFVLFLPVIGMVVYFSIGINYRKRKMYNKKLKVDAALKEQLEQMIHDHRKQLKSLQLPILKANQKLIHLSSHKNLGNNTVLPNSFVYPIQNGEQLFPKIIEALYQAKKHIHIEYYIYENDTIGHRIKEVLIYQAKRDVEVRLLYDDFGSRSLRYSMVNELRQAGVQVVPFHRVRLPFLANRLNYRNHRKIIIIDGTVGFTGGINISDRYINSPNTTPYWRDTHLMLQGLSALALQRVFLSDWNFCSNEPLTVNAHYFPLDQPINEPPIYTQIVSGGPDSDLPNILFTLNSAIQSAQDEILLATPYFIPDATLQENLILAALSGVKVKLLVPDKSDSRLVDLASRSYFEELLRAGVDIYLYTKGFLHSKTFVIDRKVASVGTANLDLRSFDLNFEVMALIYHQDIAIGLSDTFYEDLKDARQICNEQWQRRSKLTRFTERIVRLISPLM